ncbi:MAG: choice-of-anchor J domain-containing protein [Bacteroidota bacterium]
MKKIYLTTIALTICIAGIAQIQRANNSKGKQIKSNPVLKQEIKSTTSGTTIFYEDFQHGIPSTFTLINNDQLPPYYTFFGDAAWIPFADDMNAGDTVAASTSYCLAPGTTDDWMITPAITITNECVLEWEARVFDKLYRDGYIVKISTTNNQMASFTNSLLTIPSENFNWTKRALDLSAFAGQTIYIAFINNSMDKNLLYIDDITVKEKENYDITLNNATFSPNNKYLSIPISQAQPVYFQADISNRGISSVSSVILDIDVPATGFTATTTNSNTLAPMDTIFGMTHYTPLIITSPDTIRAIITASITENETITSDNIDSVTFIVSDSVMARENGDFNDYIGYPDNKITFGQMYELDTKDTLTSVSFYSNNPIIGDSVLIQVWHITPQDTSIVASTDKYVFHSADSGWFTVPIDGNYFVMQANQKYIISVRQCSTNSLEIGTTNQIFTPEVAYCMYEGESWVLSEDSYLPVTYAIRANFGKVIPLLNNDVAVKSINGPIASCSLGNEIISVNIKNYGLNAISNFPIKMNVDGTVISENITATINSMGAYTYTFTVPANLSTQGNHTIRVYTQLSTDQKLSNDTAVFVVNTLAAKTIPYSMGFEPNESLEGWQIIDKNNDGNTWFYEAIYGGHGGPGYITYEFNSNAANDYLVSTCINFEAGKTYNLGFYYRAMDGNSPEKMRVYLLDNQTSGSPVSQIVNLSNIANSTYAKSSSNFTVPATGSYYLGFNIYSVANSFLLFLDDISITETTEVNELKQTDISIFPNPANDEVNISANENINNISIINALGQIVYSAEVGKTTIKVNTSSFEKGIYFVKIQTENSSINQKVIIN